jgi:hypothetical protein
LGLSFGSVTSILTEDMGMKCVWVKFVPKVLIVKQKETHLAVARDWLHCADQDADFMKTLITGLGSMGMIHKQKSRPKMAHQVQSKVKVILRVVFNHKGVLCQSSPSAA